MDILSINPELWGPHAWKFLHYITLSYPTNPTESDKHDYKMFFEVLGKVLPCQKCKKHFQNNLVDFPLTDEILSTRWNLAKWMLQIHNRLNLEHGKKIYTFDEFYDEYVIAPNESSYTYMFMFLTCVLLLIICVLRR